MLWGDLGDLLCQHGVVVQHGLFGDDLTHWLSVSFGANKKFNMSCGLSLLNLCHQHEEVEAFRCIAH